MRLTQQIPACLIFAAVFASSASGAEKYTLHTFKRTQLTDKFYSEGANFGDFNHDGVMDIVSGPYWYAGPNFTERHEYYPAVPLNIAGYSENFFAFTYDVDHDGWTDIIIVGFPGKDAWWFQNPHGKKEAWDRYVIWPTVDDESPTFTDITGDGVPELVCASGGQFGYAEIPKDDPTQQWKFHAITPKRGYQRFTHGMGVGDVNNDGRMDLLEKDGWWEQPAPDSKAKFWKFHPFKFSEGGGSQMYAFDVNGDGRNDVVTSKAAHAYGLSWFENVPGKDGEITFQEHKFMGERPDENEYGVAFSQLHAVAIADMDHDGIPDIITGKRFWAHAEHDPGSLDPAVLYWFQTVRERGGGVHFVPHRIDMNSGVGTQVVVGDLNGDGWDDIVVGNKKGTFVFIHQTENVNKKAWEAAQPMPLKVRPPEPKAGQGAGQPKDGIPPVAADGRVLNLDFEKGDLTDWTATGTAFQDMPVEGDTVHARRSDSVSGHKGRYWVGTYERAGDGPQGSLTSVAFSVKHPFASFLVGGGAGGAERVEIVRADNDEVVFQASGRSVEEMRPAVADLRKLMGKQIFVRVVDAGSSGWGHINFDHFRFYDERPEVKDAPQAGTADVYPYAGLPAEKAAQEMKVPDGFSVKVAAAEPDVKQPVAMALDDRGRLWVAEAYTYPIRAPEGQGKDRIVIFEDTKGDGHFDKRKVFIEGLNLVSGLEVGFGGVFVGAAPNLLFIPDRNGDDIPDGKPEVLLDGWAYEDTHETLNTFTWGPDGWLYGCHGVFTHSNVGKPGTPKSQRVPINAGIWRFHPTTHKFEVFAEGTSNPWGIAFDDHGQAFCTACVIPHLYHIIQGARYQRQAGEHFNPYTYADIQTIADHRHYIGATPHAGNGRSGDAGGGHAHCGAMIYLGGAWPDVYRHNILMNNIHGQRANDDILERAGSGFVGHHGKDFLLTGDLASQMLNFVYGPDGQVYVNDWYDMTACHTTQPEAVDRSNGRIYKIVYGQPGHKQPVDLKKLTDGELAELVLEKNDWYVQHSRRILAERAAAGSIDRSALDRLNEIATSNPDETRRLRAIWALHVTRNLSDGLVPKLLHDPNEYVRCWAIQLSLDRPQAKLAELLPEFESLAKSDPSPVVRLYLASAMQRVPVKVRWNVLEQLVQHADDARDHNLPLMYWYAAEPLAEVDSDRALAFGLNCGKTIPLLREFMLRRIGSLDSNSGVPPIVSALEKSQTADEQLTILHALRTALAGQRHVKPPVSWSAAFANLLKSNREDIRNEATALGVTFGDPGAFQAFRKLVASSDADASSRRDALKSLLAAKDPELVATLHVLLAEPALRDAALSGLALYDDPQTPAKILAVYSTLSASEKRAALATLASRAPYAVALLTAVSHKEVPTTDLSADLIRQLHNLRNKKVDEALNQTWGQVRSTPADKKVLIDSYRKLLTRRSEQAPDPQLGRAVFGRTCQQCHTLYGVGADIGPNLTGSNRSDMEYLLSNIVDPSAIIAKEYQPTVFVTSDGRVITGIVHGENDKSVTVRTATDTIILPKNEVEQRSLSSTSMMPEDQLKQFSAHEILSLFAYLRGKAQVPMLATKENASTLFNGRDLTGWLGDPRLWSVEKGEIVGRSPGIGSNTFLISDLAAENFHLSLDLKLVNDEGNSGVQFRSDPVNGYGEMRGYQADVGPGWWGKLYEENGRAVLSDKSGEPYLKKGDWNHYEIDADGNHIRTWLNGHPCVDIEDPHGKTRGQFGLQLHAGGPTEVRFRNIKLEVK